MKNKKIIPAAAACWWLIVLAVMYWIENRLFGGVFECASINLLVCSVVLAIIRFIEEPPDAQMVFLLGLLLLLGLFITIQFSGICTVASMQTMLEENGYTQTAYKGEQSYLLLNALYGDAPARKLKGEIGYEN